MPQPLKNRHLGRCRGLTTYFSIAYYIFLSLVLLLPLPKIGETLNHSDILKAFLSMDFLVHVCLLIPWGFSAAAWKIHALKLIPAAIALAILLEVFQQASPHRVFEISDLVANIAGTMIGLMAGRTFLFRDN